MVIQNIFRTFVLKSEDMKVTNTTKIPNEIIREVIRFTRPPGIKNFDVMIKNSSDYFLAGRAYTKGNSTYHATADPFIVCRIPKPDYVKEVVQRGTGFIVKRKRKSFPRKLRTYQIGHLKGKRYWLADQTECLVYILAHELRHLWQAKAKNKSGYYPKSRGRFSEIDTEGYAITMLRKWRKEH